MEGCGNAIGVPEPEAEGDACPEEEEESEDEANTQSQPATYRQVSVETLREEEEESEDELLMTTANNRKLEREIKEHTISMIHKKSFKFAAFRKEHPQVMSHHVRLVPEHEGLIPNFIGGSMPRKDSGSREQYCMTMLTLFRPWRSGKDLRKDENTLWDEEFNAYQFTSRQQAVMHNFHIRYECNDARDDFSAQRKRAASGTANPLNMSDEDMDEIETGGYIYDGESIGADHENQIVNANDWNQENGAEILRKTRMATAENVM